jgi:pimeloyl-ACP methyl ester carboxylesterase
MGQIHNLADQYVSEYAALHPSAATYLGISGYDDQRLADDVLRVLDSLKIGWPVLVGHSMAGGELTTLGNQHSSRLAGLVYLDALGDPRDWPASDAEYRALLETDRIALLPSRLPPLGIAVLVRQLRQLSVCDFSPGVLGSAARLLGHYIYTGALLASGRSVDRLPVTLPAPTTTRSGSCAVLAGPSPQLVRTGEGELTGPQFATVLSYAAGGLAADWVTGQLAPQWRVSGVDPVPLPAASRHWWGTGKLVEFAAAIPDVGPLYQMVSSVRQELCHWCGVALIGDRCAFCAAPAGSAERRPQALSAGTPRRALT